MRTCLTILLIVICVSTFAQSQTDLKDSLFIKENYCDENFSLKGDDLVFTNYYISNYLDTVFFNNNNCIVSIELTSPPTFRRHILGGLAEGDLQIFNKNESSFSWTYGTYKKGIIVDGVFFEYYENDKFKTTGQYLKGQKQGVWTWYYESGRIKDIIAFQLGEPIMDISYDKYGNISDEYNFIKEKLNFYKKAPPQQKK